MPFQGGQVAVRDKMERLGKSLGYLCSGCGVCTGSCPSHAAKMVFEPELGSFIPVKVGLACGNPCIVCEKACPFMADAPATPSMTQALYGQVPGVQVDEVLGYYTGAYVGYSEAHRLRSASGGLLTWVLERLLEQREVTGIVCVGPDAQSPTLFSYRICRTAAELRECSGSCYQPVPLADVLREIQHTEGCYAIVALPCAAKALRLAMNLNAKLRQRIKFILGLACGGNCSRHFVDYVSQRFMMAESPIFINFRFKRTDTRAQHRFVFGFHDAAGNPSKKEATFDDGIGRIYQSHHFTLEACHYCDDIFAECADAVFMDAWLPEYERDWRGDTIVLPRDLRFKDLMTKGIAASAISARPISPERVKLCQIGSIRGRRGHNSFHVAQAVRQGGFPPSFRSVAPTFNHWASAWLERRIRRVANQVWLTTHSAPAVDRAVKLPVLFLGLLRILARKRIPLVG
jgi:coenzyme F420 hydrogenase subunit beta